MAFPREWHYGLNLSCPHDARIELGIADNFTAAWELNHSVPMRKDGYWPRAHRCALCKRVRRVKSLFIELVTG